MKRTKLVMLALVASMLVINGCGSSDNNSENSHVVNSHVVNSIDVNSSKLHPEGIAYNSKDEQFYLSSYYHGKIVSVDTKGNVSLFAEDDSLVTIVGMKVDVKNNRLLACNSDSGFGKKSSDTTQATLAEVVVYDLSSKKKIQTYDLSDIYKGGHFINDLTLDTAGNIYVTDSFSPVIYKITTDGVRSIFSQDDRFMVEVGQFGLNGIVASDEYLIVAKSAGAKLFKIALNDGTNIEEISVDKNLNSIDGLLLNTNNELLVVSNNFISEGYNEAVYKLHSSDEYMSASVVDTFKVSGNVYPTTLTTIDEEVYLNYSYLPALITHQPDVEIFRIEHIEF